MRSSTAVIERGSRNWTAGYIPGFPGAHSQAGTLDEPNENLAEVVAMLLEDGEPPLEGDFVGTQTIQVA